LFPGAALFAKGIDSSELDGEGDLLRGERLREFGLFLSCSFFFGPALPDAAFGASDSPLS